MRSKVSVLFVAVALSWTGLVLPVGTVLPAASLAEVAVGEGGILWAPCQEVRLLGMECGTLSVPLDHDNPSGQAINLSLTRIRHTSPDSEFQGAVLLNRGQWPGSFGRDLPPRFAGGSNGLAADVAATYDWIGFDPRGVGASEPRLACDPTYLSPGYARPDYAIPTAEQERQWLAAAKRFADSCGAKYGETLNYLGTEDAARDIDLIRQGLGLEQINYYGYDYGSYLGSVYASLFPDRVRRMVVDGVVGPTGTSYANSLLQDVAFEVRVREWFAWIARHDDVYHLGSSRKLVEANYYEGMNALRDAPIDGNLGPAEYDDIFLVNAYRTFVWDYHATVLADWVLRQDATGLRANFLPVVQAPGQNTFAMIQAVQCRDSIWPRNWTRWRRDARILFGLGAKYRVWSNMWQNAPCLFWPVEGDSTPVRVGAASPDILMVQTQFDGATPTGGALATHLRFPNSRFVLETGGVFHGASLTANGNTCLNDLVSAYLRDGTRPAAAWGIDQTCAAPPRPVPTP